MKTLTLWVLWIIIVLAGLGYFLGQLVIGDDKSDYLIGETTYGHYQIELACESCHTSPFGGSDVLQEACLNCHAEELDIAHDSHPKSKFTDPRNANLLKIIDARYCISCHTEHQKEQTLAMGVTLPGDYCYHCHQEIGDDRESHKDLPYDSCASAGCHNYHDNRALYEKFLTANSGKPFLAEHWTKEDQSTAEAFNLPLTAVTALKTTSMSDLSTEKTALQKEHADAPNEITNKIDSPAIIEQWHQDSHAQAGINCSDCHLTPEDESQTWIDKPNHTQCQNCHKNETSGFLAGKHGMRLNGELSASLSPITTKDAQLPFTADSENLHQGCNACHGAHSFDTKIAAVDSCLGCHNDQHSLAFLASPHGKIWQHNKTTDAFQSVTCATCHMPRIETIIKENEYLLVQHNQNDTLRPNEKMIRPVCLRCHSLEFSIDALADDALIKNNFNGIPKKHIESIDWALKRDRK